jgi:hypothetical protein
MNASPRAREHPPHRGHDSVARTNQSPKNKIARSHIPVQTGQSSHPCRLPAFPLCVLPSVGAGHAPCTRPYIFPPSLPFPGLDATVLADPRHSFRAASLRAASVRLSRRPGVVPAHHMTGVMPVATHPVGQRLGTGAGTALLGGSAVGAVLAPTVIRRRFRSTVAVPIPFTRARSSTRRKGPCCRRYATIAWALCGPTFVNPCCSVDASAVLMLMRSAAKAAPVNSSPSASAFHEIQGPTV